MGKSSKPNFPSPPQFQADPFLQSSQQGLSDTGQALRQGKFLNPNDPTVGFLNQLVSLNPEATRRGVELASRDTIEFRDKAQQDIINQLEANNQLTSSVTGNRLSDLNQAFSSDIADISTNFYLADVERSLTNVRDLFGTGLNTLSDVGDRGLQNQQQVNTFAENRFASETALEAERFSRQQEGERQRASAFGPVFGLFDSGASGFNQGIDTNNNRTAGIAGIFSGGQGQKQTSGQPDGGLSSQNDQGLNQRLLLQNKRNSSANFGGSA